MLIMNSIVGVFLIVIGFLVKKYPDLIAGYNTMSAEQKEKVDINGLSNHMRNSMIVMGGLIVIVDPLLNLIGLREYGTGIFIAIILIGTFYIWINAQTFSKNSNKHRNIVRTVTKYVIFVVFALVIFGFLFYGTRSTEVTVRNRQIEISGIYGMTAKVINIELYESIPTIKKKTNGFNYGSTLKGSFDLEEIGRCKLFIESSQGPYIFLETESGTPIIINTESRKKTEELLAKLNAEIEK